MWHQWGWTCWLRLTSVRHSDGPTFLFLGVMLEIHDYMHLKELQSCCRKRLARELFVWHAQHAQHADVWHAWHALHVAQCRKGLTPEHRDELKRCMSFAWLLWLFLHKFTQIHTSLREGRWSYKGSWWQSPCPAAGDHKQTWDYLKRLLWWQHWHEIQAKICII